MFEARSLRAYGVLMVIGVLLSPRVSTAATMTLTWQPNPEAEVIGYLVYVGQESGVYSETIDVQNASTYVYSSAVPGRVYCFALVAYADSDMSPRSQEVCASSYGWPTLVNPGNQAGAVGEATWLQLTGSSPAGVPVSYSASGLPTGLTISPDAGIVSGTPTTPATYAVTVSVSDGRSAATQLFNWTIGVISGRLRHASSASAPTGTSASVRPAPVAPSTPAPARTLAAAAAGERASLAAGTTVPSTTRSAVPRPVVPGGSATGTPVTPARTPPAVARAPDGATLTRALARAGGSIGLECAIRPGACPASASTPSAVTAPGAPRVSIDTPVDQATFGPGTTVIFMASASSVLDGDLRTLVVWTSDRDGRIGTGALLHKELTAGVHVITASVTDARGNGSSARVTVVVR